MSVAYRRDKPKVIKWKFDYKRKEIWMEAIPSNAVFTGAEIYRSLKEAIEADPQGAKYKIIVPTENMPKK